jgi:hypothetical protein
MWTIKRTGKCTQCLEKPWLSKTALLDAFLWHNPMSDTKCTWGQIQLPVAPHQEMSDRPGSLSLTSKVRHKKSKPPTDSCGVKLRLAFQLRPKCIHLSRHTPPYHLREWSTSPATHINNNTKPKRWLRRSLRLCIVAKSHTPTSSCLSSGRYRVPLKLLNNQRRAITGITTYSLQ